MTTLGGATTGGTLPSPGPTGRSIADLVSKAATGNARVVFPGTRLTLSELDRRADDYARLIVDAGVAPGGRVALWMPPSPELLAALFGVVRAGAVAVPISDRFRSAEIAIALRRSAPDMVITTRSDDYLDRPAVVAEATDLASVGGPAASLPAVVYAEDVEHPDAEPGRDGAVKAWHRSSRDDLAMLMFTSGTSAEPKACKITHNALLWQARTLAEERYLLDEASVVWTPLPLFHIAGLVSMLATFHAGASFVHSGVFRPDTSVDLIDSEKATHALAAFETIWMQLLDEADRRGSGLSSIAAGLSSNGAQQLALLQARLPGVAFLANYGSTEGSGHVAMARVDEPVEVRMQGGALVVPGDEVRIVEPGTDTPVVIGETGELQFRGVTRFAGYLDDQAADMAALAAGGWFRTGDLASVDQDGRLYFAGRLKDMLKVGGENVAALEVESYLLTHPAVSVAAVVGAPDDFYGEVPVAYLELAPGAQLSGEELIAYCWGKIASYKVPRYVRFLTEWPMSGTKIRKEELRERIRSELHAAGITVAPRSSGREASPR